MRRIFLAVATLVCGFTQPGVADVIFSNVIGNNIPNTDIGTQLGSEASVAFSFVVPGSQSYLFTRIDIALETTVPGSSADVMLMTDTGGLPGEVLESFLIPNLPPFDINVRPLESAASTLFPQLQGGAQYWVAVILPGNNTDGEWIPNVIGDNGPEALQITGSNWMTNIQSTAEDVFRIDGQPMAVPEPNLRVLLTMVIVTLGMSKCAQRRRPR